MIRTAEYPMNSNISWQGHPLKGIVSTGVSQSTLAIIVFPTSIGDVTICQNHGMKCCRLYCDDVLLERYPLQKMPICVISMAQLTVRVESACPKLMISSENRCMQSATRDLDNLRLELWFQDLLK